MLKYQIHLIATYRKLKQRPQEAQRQQQQQQQQRQQRQAFCEHEHKELFNYLRII